MTYGRQHARIRERRASPLLAAPAPLTPHRVPVPSPPTPPTGRYAC